jgi:cell division transport system permease protein
MGAVAKAEVFWRSALQGIRHQPFPHAVAVLTLTIALFALGLGRAASGAVDHVLASLGSDVQVTVWLKPEAPAANVNALVASLRGRGFAVQLVTAREALERLGRELGPASDALRGLGSEPLPPSLELGVPAGWREPASLRRLAQELQARAEVTQVDWGEAAVERLGALARALRWAGLFAFAVLLGATVVVVSATLQLAIYARRGEVEIQKLVGATDRFVRAPFLIEGLLQGLAGAVLALLGLAVVLHLVAPELQALFAFLQVPSASTAPLWGVHRTLELLGVGAGLGLLGSFLAVSRALRA